MLSVNLQGVKIGQGRWGLGFPKNRLSDGTMQSSVRTTGSHNFQPSLIRSAVGLRLFAISAQQHDWAEDPCCSQRSVTAKLMLHVEHPQKRIHIALS